MNLSKGYVSKINTGYRFQQANEHYPLRPIREINKEEILLYMLENPKKARQEFADLFNVSLSTIKRIKANNKNLF